MADEFVEVVNTTITSTELPTNNSTHTLKTAGAAESFAIKDIGIKTGSQVAEYSFLLNDFEALSFGAGESGLASGLDLLPQSGTLKIKGKNIPIDSEAIITGRPKAQNSGKINKGIIIPEYCRPDSSKSNISFNYQETETFPAFTNSIGTDNNTFMFAWLETGSRIRKIVKQDNNSSGVTFKYIDGQSATANQISQFDFEYVPDLNKIYYLSTAGNKIYQADSTADISFSLWQNLAYGNFTTYLGRLHYSKGWLWACNNVQDNYPDWVAINTTTGVQLSFTDAVGKNYTGGNSSTTAMGWCVNYNPEDDSFYHFRTSYQTSNPQYISRHKIPKTLTQMNAYASNTSISDTIESETNNFTRAVVTDGPFQYDKPHHLRGSEASKSIFYLPEPDVHNPTNTIYYYDFDANELSSTGLSVQIGDPTYNGPCLIFRRDINTADETEVGGSFSEVDVRVTAIKTT
jgi:hypothetical protein